MAKILVKNTPYLLLLLYLGDLLRATNTMRVRKWLLLWFAVMSSLGFSQFKFNEYSCANVGTVIDPLGVGYEASPDWIEIMNTSSTKLSLSGYYLSQNKYNNNSFQIPLFHNLPIKVDSFGMQVIYLCSHNTETVSTNGINTATGVDIHASFQLNQTQASVLYLFTPSGLLSDSVTIRRNKPDHSWGKPNSDSSAYFNDTTTTTPTTFGWGSVGCGLNAWRLYLKATPGKKNPTNRGAPWYGIPPIPPKYYFGYAPTPKLMTKPGCYSSASLLNNFAIKDTTPQTGAIPHKDSLEIFVTTNCSRPITVNTASVWPTFDYGPHYGTNASASITIPLVGGGTVTHTGVVVRAVLHDEAHHPNYADGFEAYGAYVLDSTYHMAISCFCIDTNLLFAAPNPADTSGTYTIPDSTGTLFCYIDKTSKKQVYANQGQGLINRIDFLNTFAPKRQWQFQFRAEDEYGYSYTNKHAFFTDQSLGLTARPDYPELVFRSSAEDNFLKGGIGGITKHGATHLRDFFNHTLTLRHKLNFESSHYVPTYLFINGINRGIYYVKEPIDTTYTNYYFNHARADIIASDLLPGTATHTVTALAGKLTDWNTFYTWAMSNGFNVHMPTLYQQFADDFDIQSFIDYNFYNMLSVNANFVRNQALWWKGIDTAGSNLKYTKWRFALSNTDITWGSNYNTIPINNDTNSSPCDYMTAFNFAHSSPSYPLMPLFSKLMTNDTFKSAFFSRYQDLLNTSYSCDTLTTHLAYVKSLLKADIPSQVWWNVAPGSCATCDSVKIWSDMVDSMNTFIKNRCLAVLRNLASSSNCFNYDGPYNLCINVQPSNGGYVNFNTLSLHNFTWNGTYIDSVTYHAYAVPDSNYVFDHWEGPYTINPNNTTDSMTFQVNQSACLTAVFKLKPPYDTWGTPAIPTAFSPNSDGNNDLLNIYGIAGATSYSFEIYNRWGEQLFHSNDKTKGWDGTYPDGTAAAVGVYAYRYDIVINGKTYIKNGNITLLR